ncbi:DUF402 domain-containing protein [uncultured Corynebacterium sp.]|uniref:DUF402 domain-containing protein n=1 Tax=uncultured Corynebacterium sp. TaxID=159447 RepID=UPI0025EA2FF1|nr:DUF402 domain-containing protein [uncultured Corynebacterium sp.]
MNGAHPPKTEIFDTASDVNTDPKGIARKVERWGGDATALYMARPADHPRFGYLESWLLPDVDLRVNRFHFRNGTGHGSYPCQDLYVDIALVDPPVSPTDGVWRTTDLYIDLVTYAGGYWEVLDLDELGDALTAGHVDAETARRALDSAQRLITGMIDGGSVEGWLSGRGINLTWADPGAVTPAPPVADA